MIKTLLDKNADASLRILISTCVIVIVITSIYSIWRIQVAGVALRESGREQREFMQRLEDHLGRQDAMLSRLIDQSKKAE